MCFLYVTIIIEVVAGYLDFWGVLGFGEFVLMKNPDIPYTRILVVGVPDPFSVEGNGFVCYQLSSSTILRALLSTYLCLINFFW